MVPSVDGRVKWDAKSEASLDSLCEKKFLICSNGTIPSPPLRFRLSYFVTGLPCMRSSSLCTFRDGGANFVSVLALRFDSGVLGVLFSFVLPNSR